MDLAARVSKSLRRGVNGGIKIARNNGPVGICKIGMEPGLINVEHMAARGGNKPEPQYLGLTVR